MKTLYIDVYFLINFTVDLIALYFASCLSKVPTNRRRLIFSAVIGALGAVAIVFLPEFVLLKLVTSTVSLVVMGMIAPKGASLRRKVKFTMSFIVFAALVGGAVTFIWDVFDRYISDFIDIAEGGVVNRKMLILALIVLLSIGVFKMIVSFFSNTSSEESVDVEISFNNRRVVKSAFVDSGNLAVDPMDMSPILFLKKDAIKDILPENIINICDVDGLEKRLKKRIRLIPISRGGSTHVLVGLKPDAVRLMRNEGSEELRVTLAIDKEGGNYGGYKALMPSAALDNVGI